MKKVGGFALHLGRILAGRGVSFGKLADEIGVSRTTVLRWLNGRSRHSKLSLAALSSALGMPSCELIPHSDARSEKERKRELDELRTSHPEVFPEQRHRGRGMSKAKTEPVSEARVVAGELLEIAADLQARGDEGSAGKLRECAARLLR